MATTRRGELWGLLELGKTVARWLLCGYEGDDIRLLGGSYAVTWGLLCGCLGVAMRLIRGLLCSC